VASSRDFDVLLNAETANLIGSDDVANIMPVDNIGFTCPTDGGSGSFIAGLNALTVGQQTIIDSRDAGGSDVNEFQIEWELATPALVGVTGRLTLLGQSLNPDNYVVNTFIVVDPE
jgi:hypothetical protein